MADLDDLQALAALDPGGMAGHLHGFPAQCRAGWDQAAGLRLPPTYRDVQRVIVAGMGGSAMAGEALADLAAQEKGPLVHVHRDYGLPSWADERTLVVVSSYSGATEEALSSFAEARARGLKIVAVTSGGTLAERARKQRVPLLPIPLQAPPRTTFGFTLLALLRLLTTLGLLADKEEDVREMERVLPSLGKELGPESPGEVNPAKRLARALWGHLPVVCGGGVLAGAARRWKTQINENAKMWAFAEALPEMDHNGIVALEAPLELRQRAFVVFLRGSALPPRLLARYALTEGLLREYQVPSAMVHAQGESPLVQVLTAVLYGDWVSLYLAALHGVDPTPIPPIDLLKSRLAEG